MNRLLIIYGMKRSGNHALIHWIQGQGRFAFFNNIVPVKKHLRNGTPMPDPTPFGPWLAERLAARRGECLREFRWRQLLGELRPPVASVMASLEEQDASFHPFRDIPVPTTRILIVRHPRNLFASRLRKSLDRDSPETYPRDNGPWQQRIVSVWKSHARELLGDTTSLPGRVAVYFDLWVSDPASREKTSRELGLPFSDRGFGRVAREGGGSSFAGTSANDTGGEGRMDVLRRGDQLDGPGRDVLEEILRDPEVRDLATRLENLFPLPVPR